MKLADINCRYLRAWIAHDLHRFALYCRGKNRMHGHAFSCGRPTCDERGRRRPRDAMPRVSRRHRLHTITSHAGAIAQNCAHAQGTAAAETVAAQP